MIEIVGCTPDIDPIMWDVQEQFARAYTNNELARAIRHERTLANPVYFVGVLMAEAERRGYYAAFVPMVID